VDFAAWQRRHISGSVLTAEIEHWKSALSGAPAEIALPLDHPRPERPSGQAETIAVLMDGREVQKLKQFAQQHGCTPFMVFLAGLMITLQRWTGQEDMVVGTVVAGRTRREIEKLIGCFMNFLPLRARVANNSTAQETIASVRAAVLDAQSHQECPFEKIVEAINPQRRRAQNPLYNVALLLQNFPANLFETSSLEASSVPVAIGAALLDLRFEIVQAQGDALSMACEYKTDLFEPRTVERLLTSWRETVRLLVEAPQKPITEFQLAGPLQPGTPNIEAHTSRGDTMVVAATFTAEPVLEPLRYWLDRLALGTDVEFAPYNQVFQQLLDPGSGMARNKHGLNVVLVRLEDWQRQDSGIPQTTAIAIATVERNAADFVAALKTAASRGSVPLLVCFCPASPVTLADSERASALARIQRDAETRLSELPGVHVLTGDELAGWYPVKEYHDAAGEQLGHVPYTPPFFTALGTGLVRKYHALKRSAYKVIALDCDNTLWSGICGEAGPAGISLEPARRALQDFMVQQRDCGMLLCLCSKNNAEDVQAVFAQRTEFPLQMKHIAASRLNWLPKSANLRALAQELNLGLDSFIFIDDNPLECAEVRASCPEVLTLQLPDDPEQIAHFLHHCWVFDHLRVTTEDRKRAKLYEQNRQREQLRSEAPTLQEFLSGLELNVSIGPIAPEHWTRVSQLTQRTNQFNFTTKRMTEQELADFLSSGHVRVVEVSDRFGDYGLVGAMFYHTSAESLFVDNLLLSCRVLSRGVEHQMIARLGSIARESKLSWVDAKFVPSAKNHPALNFLDQCCGQFKQPLNGGSVYRMPAGFAAEVVFRPEERRASGGEATVEASRSGTAGSGSRFASCGAIAIESGDLAKVHAQIQKPRSTRRASGGYTAPRTDLERQLCVLWQDLLRIESVGVTDDFFELGGHSLLAVRLFAEIEKLLGRKFPLVTLFQAPTISRLAKVLSDEGDAGSLLVPIQPNGDKPPLFLVHGAGGDVLWGYANLAAHLPPDQPIYGIRSHGQQGGEEKTHLEEMALSYLDVVRARQPEGPYHLGGYCFGGNVAYEMARQLSLQGQEVALVVLLDSAPANAGYETVTWWRPTFPWRFLRNVRFWLVDFFGLESLDRRRFVGRKIRAVGRKLKKRLGLGKATEERFNVEEVIDPRHFPESELKLWQTHLEALIAHVERPYAGRVALLRTRGQPIFCSLQEDFCWGKLVKGRFTMRCIPGSHENIFMEPNVRVLGAELSELLKETTRATSSTGKPAVPVMTTEGANKT
jgi:FkbH-like protein